MRTGDDGMAQAIWTVWNGLSKEATTNEHVLAAEKALKAISTENMPFNTPSF